MLFVRTTAVLWGDKKKPKIQKWKAEREESGMNGTQVEEDWFEKEEEKYEVPQNYRKWDHDTAIFPDFKRPKNRPIGIY